MYEDNSKAPTYENNSKAPTVGVGSLNPLPILMRLKNQRSETLKRLANLEVAIKLLEENPTVMQVIESLNKLGGY